MDLVRLSNSDKPFQKKYQPEILVENHSSLVWAERSFGSGDFVRESYDIEGTLRDLPVADENGEPIDTIVTLSDSIVPMVVEVHKVTKSLTGPPMITTTGRSFETILGRRTTLSREDRAEDVNGKQPLQMPTLSISDTINKPVPPWVVKHHSSAAAAHLVLNRILSTPDNAIPEVILGSLPPDLLVGALREFQVTPGNLYEWVAEQLQQDEISIVPMRPIDQVWPQVYFEFYKGRDRTSSVSFDVDFDQFPSTEYILSNAWWKNESEIAGANGSVIQTDGVVRTGMAKRISYTDQSQIAKSGIDTTPGSAEALVNLLRGLGTVDLQKQPQTVLFSGEISQQAASKYDSMRNQSSDPSYYYLGDKIALRGDYGLERYVRVAEFIRSEDASGESAYPTFSSLNMEQ